MKKKGFIAKNKRTLIVVFLLAILITTSLFVFINNKPFVSAKNAKAVNSNVSSTPYGCHNKAKLGELYNILSKIELKNLIATAKSQKIYKDYSGFLESKGYKEYVDGAFGGFFKKTPAIKKDIKYSDKNNRGFSYIDKLQIKKPYILIIPFVNPTSANNIAGIVFVYSNQRIESFIVRESVINGQSNKVSTNIFVESSNGKIISIKDAETESFFIDWQCFWSCIPGCVADCIEFPPGANALCYSICWAICYDMRTLSKP